MPDNYGSESHEVNAPVHVEPYDTAWPERFATEAAVIGQTIGPWITGGIHHVGSTAVPGLAAKPVIDIMVGVADLELSRPCIELLKPLSYCYRPYRAEVMHWFCKPRPGHRTHHVHLVPTGSPRYLNVLAFRDYLRAHPDARADYEALKRELASRFPDDREAYTEGKTELIGKLTEAARVWATGWHGVLSKRDRPSGVIGSVLSSAAARADKASIRPQDHN
ncbi:GrpB family protein [Micromonospora sp. C31]|uniref:GrpB family protein n=1 Tax=Micromonospora sp. C31 TaxID=2824876 RepID=UPI001B36FBF3|nr:GrpB family protein [Micromonospora sp. C31]MBQ1074109.1 GrpB family protein [Micromonospora sp. C31]